MGRGNLSRILAAAAVAGVLATSATAAAGIPFAVVAAGGAEPTGAQHAGGYVAMSLAGTQPWAKRLTAADRKAVSAIPFGRAYAVAVFLDGLPCAQKVAVTRVTRNGRELDVDVAYTRPPIGMATCIRTSTAYRVLRLRKAPVATPAPTRVRVVAHARA
ncbi:MAG: hypothetical protein QOK13_1009 [Gaiellaceae bacterium]|nr:hypothetical protein [Gaiellaceae bacterium]